MNWLQTQMVLLDAAAAVVQFAANWFLQSALLIAIGLATGRLLAAPRFGRAVGHLSHDAGRRAVCPLASSLLSLAGCFRLVAGDAAALDLPGGRADRGRRAGSRNGASRSAAGDRCRFVRGVADAVS